MKFRSFSSCVCVVCLAAAAASVAAEPPQEPVAPVDRVIELFNGKDLLLQCEGNEIYYRRFELHPLNVNTRTPT